MIANQVARVHVQAASCNIHRVKMYKIKQQRIRRMKAFSIRVENPPPLNAVQKAQCWTSASHDCIRFWVFLFQVALVLSLETYNY